MFDYFTVEDYLKSLPTTQGRYVRITPSESSGDGVLTISQIQVIDMNGNNVALKKKVYATSSRPSFTKVSSTVDGTTSPRVGLDNVWSTDESEDGSQQYWQVDLGSVYQISKVIYTGVREHNNTGEGDEVTTPIGMLRSSGMKCYILETENGDITTAPNQEFLTTQIIQTLNFPNTINITPTPSSDTVSVLNPSVIPLNSAQPEVYQVTGNYLSSEIDTACAMFGAVVATSGQLVDAYNDAGLWPTLGWAIQSGVSPKKFILANINTTGSETVLSVGPRTTGAINCFGVKPPIGTTSNVSAFNGDIWSQYVNNTRPTYFGETTISVPNVKQIYNFVNSTFIYSTVTNVNDKVKSQKDKLPIPECVDDPAQAESITNPIFSLGKSFFKNKVCGQKVTNTLDDSISYSLSELDLKMNFIFNPNGCKQGGPQKNYAKCSISTPPDSLIINYGAYSNNGLFTALSKAPLNLVLDDGTASTGQLTGLYSYIQIFGAISSKADSDMRTSIYLCSKLFLGSDQHVSYYINIPLDTLQPTIRTNTGYKNFCKQEVVQGVSNGDYTFKSVPTNIQSNKAVCNETFTTDMLGLLPSATRDYVQTWIYNRTKRILEYKVSSKTLTQANLNSLKLNAYTINTPINTITNAVKKMYPTVNNASIPIDLTNNYILDKIAQAYYEAMGGNYIMSQIYDVSTIGGTILDIRFDMTKHADITAIQTQIAELTNTYYTIRASNVSQDILDEAKNDYETNVANLNAQQSASVFPAVTGTVGRFFYTYSTDTQEFNITGFTLDVRAVTSFIPELNGGVEVATGGAAGAINYTPTILYTKNIPQALQCNEYNTLRKIMDDYVDLTQTDLQSVLLGKLSSNNKTRKGPAGAPSMDTRLGTVHVNKIIGAVQVSPTQCAVKWTETLWNDASNVPLKDSLTNITRRALFSYTVDTADWYSNIINIDPSGVIFYATDNIPSCIFDTIAWKKTASPRLDDSVDSDIIADFVTNGWNNGMGVICPASIPNYIFSAQDYCAANSDANYSFNGGGDGPLNIVGAKIDYANNGIKAKVKIRETQPIKPFDMPIIIEQPLPANNILDTLDGTCPATTCEDLNVLYSLVDQYNNDPAQPGVIQRVTKAYTASPTQCDVEVNINYDVKAENGAGKKVVKGSFTYDENGNEVPCNNCPPEEVSDIYIGAKLALYVSTNIADCTYSFNGSDGQGSGTTIQDNTPSLYKHMDYATFLTDINVPDLTASFNTITTAVSDATINSVSILDSYRKNTANAVGSIATLGSGCTTKCTDTTVMNNMLAFFKSQVNHTKQINTVLRMGTLNSTTCDMTYQEDTLLPSGTGYKIQSSKTAGMRFTLAPDAGSCTFKTTTMSPILPSSPYELDTESPIPSSASCEEVYGISSNILIPRTAADKCDSYGGVIATLKQLTNAATAGANWVEKGFVVDASGVFFPTGTIASRSEGTTGGVICYGVKPAIGTADVLPFDGKQWNQPGKCSTTTINYINPSKEAFMNYGTPVQVTESTFPLNTKSFGLDMARNRGGPGLDSLFVEPLRTESNPTELYGPRDIEDESLLQPSKSQSYKYIRFRPVKTRNPSNPTVDVGKFRFLTGKAEVDLRFAKVTNPMGSWVGDVGDLVGPGFRRGFSDINKKAVVFAFPYAMLINGFTWTTANPDRGVGGDPVQWKLEGSQNGTYWVTLRDQTRHDYPVPTERYQELHVFRF